MIKHSSFSGGGLKIDIDDVSSELALQVPGDVTLPPYIDSKPFCIPASNQGNNPYCAAAAWAGYFEEKDYRINHIFKQIPFEPLYKRAKVRDGNDERGTTLTSAYLACVDEGICKKQDFEVITTRPQLQFGLLTHDVVVAGFQINDNWNHTDTETGWIEQNGGSPLGGHAVLVCYWDEDGIGWQNSWGGWGCNGFGRMNWNQFAEQFVYGVVLK